MRIVNAAGRLGLVTEDGIIDVLSASGGRFPSDPQAIYEMWDEFREWAATPPEGSSAPLQRDTLGPTVPRPRQVFAIGLNYREHAAEANTDIPETPVVFTKFPASITGPTAEVELPEGDVDWEAELVVVIGHETYRVPESRAWEHVAGLTVGQDLSERRRQLAPPAPQFCMGKSFPGFAPLGPELVTVDEFDDPDDLEIGCFINGEQVQKARTSDLIFGVPALIAYLSSVLPLYPGDVVFTGTPAGVGIGRVPPRYLSPGDELTTFVQGIGTLRTTFVAPG